MIKHTIIEAKTDNKNLGNKKLTSSVLNTLVKKIRMKKLKGPVVVRGTSVPGLTGVVILETSHIIIHTYTRKKKLVLDLLSVKNFDPKIVVSYLDKTYGLKDIKIKSYK